jgi:Leucine-rich repeat (LRR) protein
MSIELYLQSLDENIESLDISSKELKVLPDLSKFVNLQELDCENNYLTSLPNNLPNSLITLNCSDNNLTSLPDILPNSLQNLYCDCNSLTSLPDNLPNSLQNLYCDCNSLTSLPENLPDGLQFLSCYYNTLTSLPDNLPESLQLLDCSIMSMYPNLDTLSTMKNKKLYIQKVNYDMGVEKCKQLLKIVNEKNIFLEKYDE